MHRNRVYPEGDMKGPKTRRLLMRHAAAEMLNLTMEHIQRLVDTG